MNKQEFAKILLSRFSALDEASRYALIETFIVADSELRRENNHDNDKRIEDLEEFGEWAQNIEEILFPETLGDVISLDDWHDELTN